MRIVHRLSFLQAVAHCALLIAVASAASAQSGTTYHLTKSVPLGLPDRWDYLLFDAPTHRVYVSHGDRVTVVDGHSGAIIGQIEGLPGGTHGVVIATPVGL